MVRLLYNILFSIFFVLSAPKYFLRMRRRGNWREGFGQRFARYEPGFGEQFAGKRVIWLHAVSVGEVNVCLNLLPALEPRLPGFTFVVSTTTSTAMGILRERLPAHMVRMYYPIDRRAHVRRALDLIHPEAVVLVEAEFWPNFIWELRDRKIPLFLANARLTEKSFRGYRRAGFLFRGLMTSFARVGAQCEGDVQRLLAIGCRPEAIVDTGSLKFDAAKVVGAPKVDARKLLARMGIASDAPVLLGGSTHPGEEAILARVARLLLPNIPNLALVLVPRHFERTPDVVRDLEGLGIEPVLRSNIDAASREPIPCAKGLKCLVVNTTGELKDFYDCASVVFVGKSLAAKGGQNPIEPAAQGKAVVFGPHMRNFIPVPEMFLKAGAARQVADEADLERTLGELLGSAGLREDMGRQARAIVEANFGATVRTADMIAEHIGDAVKP